MACIKPQLPGASPHLLAVGELSAFAICQRFFHCRGDPCTNRPHSMKPPSRTNPGGNLWGVSDIISLNEQAIFLKAMSDKLPRSHGLPIVHPEFSICAVRDVYKFTSLLLTDYFMFFNRVTCHREKLGYCNDPVLQSMRDTTVHVLR